MAEIRTPGAGTLAWVLEQRRRAEAQQVAVVAREEQRIIDVEVRNTRHVLRRALRRRLGADPVAFLDEEFLALADPALLHGAIVDAAVAAGGAGNVDLQIYDSRAGLLRIAAAQGFTAEFLGFFATLSVDEPTACALAVATRTPVVIDDVARSPVFVGRPALEPMLAAGSRAVRSYPLLAPDGAVAGVLSWHYRRPPAFGEVGAVAAAAARALFWSAVSTSPAPPPR